MRADQRKDVGYRNDRSEPAVHKGQPCRVTSGRTCNEGAPRTEVDAARY